MVRNEIIHEGKRLIPWPVFDDPIKRDWPQILDDIVGEILRYRMKATLARTLNKTGGLSPEASPETG
jgi:hypothetical protein